MSKKSKTPGPTIPEIVALLDNKRFRRDAITVLDQFRLLNETAPTQQEWDRRFLIHAEEHIAPFVRRWAVLAPIDRELVENEPSKEVIFSILTGRWGVIPVFPWTSESDIKSQAAKIRRAIGKIHKDAEGKQRGMIARWIRMNPSRQGLAPRAEIAVAVWRRRDGLRRPTRAQAIQKLPDEEEAELLSSYKKQGLSHGQASRRVYRRARGSEAPAVRMVRAAESRQEQASIAFQKELQSPKQLDKAGYYLTMLLREIFLSDPVIPAEIFKQAELLRDHLLRTSVRFIPPARKF